jgi:hypothetical protein
MTMIFKEGGCKDVDCICLVQDIAQRQTQVNMQIKFRVS